MTFWGMFLCVNEDVGVLKGVGGDNLPNVSMCKSYRFCFDILKEN